MDIGHLVNRFGKRYRSTGIRNFPLNSQFNLQFTQGRSDLGRKRQAAALFAAGVLLATSGPTWGHHSFAMFDQEHPIEVVGTVTEFRYSSPHIYIFLDVKGGDGVSKVWLLEGGSPSLLLRDGWTGSSIKPGDELRMTIDPLRSGAPGGAWQATRIKFKDGRPIVAPK
jgi:Family of unknown function (DUF6152)